MESESPKSPYPLSINLILERILGFLPRSGLEKCRLVCRNWQTTADRIIKQRNNSIAQLTSNEDVELILKTVRQNKFERFHEFKLQDLNLNNCEALIHLFEEMLPTLEVLVMERCTSSFENYHRVMSLIATTLEKFNTTIQKEIEEDKSIYYPLFPIYSSFETKTPMILPSMKQLILSDGTNLNPLSQIVLACPNLISLNAGDLMIEDPSIFQDLRLPKLRHLKLHMLKREGGNLDAVGIKVSHIRGLMNMKLELWSLGLINVHPTVPESLFKDWLESLSPTLGFLRLRSMSPDPDTVEFNFSLPYKYKWNTPVPFPLQLPNLKEIMMYKPYVKNIGLVLSSCPSITNLVLAFHRDVNWDGIMPKFLRPHESLKSLELFWIPSNAFAKLIKPFINLTALTLHDCSSKGLLDIVFSTLITLKHLTLESWYTNTSAITDKIMTGMLSGTENRTYSYIGNLRNLKTLSLNKGELISKKSIKFGVLDLPDLCFLAVNTDQRDKVSEFEQILNEAGFEHVQLKKTPGDKPLYKYEKFEYFLRRTEEFWENETSEEFILRHMKTCGGIITQVCI